MAKRITRNARATSEVATVKVDNPVVITKSEYNKLKKISKAYRSYSSIDLSDTTTGNWFKSDRYVNRDIAKAQAKLVQLSRQLEKEEPLYKKFLQMVEINVAGHKGFGLSVKVKNKRKKLEIEINDAVERAWRKWCKSDYCDVTGRNSFAEICTILAKMGERDGEYLVRHIRDVASSENPWGYQVQVLDPQRIDERMGMNTPITVDGKYVYMGVELNEYLKATGYYLKASKGENPLNTLLTTQGSSEYVKREDLIHDFVNFYPEQVRGIPPGHSAFQNIKHLSDFNQAVLIAIKIAASTSIFLETTDPKKTNATEENADAVELDENDEVLQFAKHITPGGITTLPPGYKFSSFTSQFPDAASGPFVKFMTKIISGGLGVSEYLLTSSLEDVNYTSSRTGLLEDRNTWIKKQEVFIAKVLNRIFEAWLHRSILNGAIATSTGRVLSLTDYEDICNSYEFKGRRWDWVDPMKDATTNILLIQNKLATRTSVLAELGLDYEDILAEIQEEIELEKMYLGKDSVQAETEQERQNAARARDILDAALKKYINEKDN